MAFERWGPLSVADHVSDRGDDRCLQRTSEGRLRQSALEAGLYNLRHPLVLPYWRGGAAAASAALALVQFAMFDSKPAVEAESTRTAAMLHDAEAKVGVKLTAAS